jgi:hypothetical protein
MAENPLRKAKLCLRLPELLVALCGSMFQVPTKPQ